MEPDVVPLQHAELHALITVSSGLREHAGMRKNPVFLPGNCTHLKHKRNAQRAWVIIILLNILIILPYLYFLLYFLTYLYSYYSNYTS